MSKSTLHQTSCSGIHVAILMDGNGRWAEARGWSRSAGHRAGVEAVRRVVAAAPALGVSALTLYAFSAANWQRPADEVSLLISLFERFLLTQAQPYAQQGICVRVIGRRDRLTRPLLQAIETAEHATAAGRHMELRIAVDYSARESILRAACWMLSSLEINQREFSRLLGCVTHSSGPASDVDLLIRTGGERRLSDFLLWESAYAELVFVPRMWPDFTESDLQAAIQEFHSRDRRFGKLPQAAAS